MSCAPTAAVTASGSVSSNQTASAAVRAQPSPVAAAVVQGRADWGVTLDTVARSAGLGFTPVQAEHYDFIDPRAHSHRPAVTTFKELLQDGTVRAALARLGMRP